jgi:hypothetical protein
MFEIRKKIDIILVRQNVSVPKDFFLMVEILIRLGIYGKKMKWPKTYYVPYFKTIKSKVFFRSIFRHVF